MTRNRIRWKNRLIEVQDRKGTNRYIIPIGEIFRAIKGLTTLLPLLVPENNPN